MKCPRYQRKHLSGRQRADDHLLKLVHRQLGQAAGLHLQIATEGCSAWLRTAHAPPFQAAWELAER